jgi:hypothetical protein
MRFGAEVTLRDLCRDRAPFTHFRLTLTPQPCLVQRWPSGPKSRIAVAAGDVAGAALPAPIKTLLRTRAQ